jgi:hypothetical protein
MGELNEYQYNNYDKYENNVKIHEAYTNNTTSDESENYFGTILLLFVSSIFCSYFYDIVKNKIVKECNNYKINNELNETILNIETEIICSICLENLKKNEKCIEFECKHIYHKNCIKEWLQNHKNCPNCRKIII